MHNVSDTPETTFAAVRRRRSLPACARDAPFTPNHARMPDIDPPKRFGTRPNPTSRVPRAQQALCEALEDDVCAEVGRCAFDLAKSQVRYAPVSGARAVLAHPARIFLSSNHTPPRVV